MNEAIDVVVVSSTSLMTAVDVSPEPIHTAFRVATFLPQPFFILMIVLPNNKVTKQLMAGLGTNVICCIPQLF